MIRVFFVAIGVGVILAVSLWGWLNYRFIGQSSIARGEVVKLNSGGSHPQIRFAAEDGREFDYPQGGLIFGYQTGDKVEILYEAQNPKSASINSFGALWGFPLLILLIGFIFFIVGILQ